MLRKLRPGFEKHGFHPTLKGRQDGCATAYTFAFAVRRLVRVEGRPRGAGDHAGAGVKPGTMLGVPRLVVGQL